MARIAGLPADVLTLLTCPEADRNFDQQVEIQRHLEAARQELVGRIAAELTSFEAPARRFLLRVKRDCFNRRPVVRLGHKPQWAHVTEISSHMATEILRLETRLQELEHQIFDLYGRQFEAERRHVTSLAQNSRFARGIALGAPGLVDKARLRSPHFLAGQTLGHPKKWEASLLRFVIRAAAKLSANSTFTAYSLGSVAPLPEGRDLRFHRQDLQERSLVRADRPPLEQLLALIFSQPTARAIALVQWNDSIEEVEPNRFRFVREGHWRIDVDSGQFLYTPSSRITVKFGAKWLDAIRSRLSQSPKLFSELVLDLEQSLGILGLDSEAEDPETVLGRLVGVGLLTLIPPWPSEADRIEERVHQMLRSLPPFPGLEPLVTGTEILLRKEKSFAEASDPVRAVADLRESFVKLALSARRLAAIADGNVASAPAAPGLEIRPHFYEDVLLEPAEHNADDTTFHISSTTVERLQRSLLASARLAGLFNTRHDALHTLAHWWRQHHPAREEMPLVEAARGFAPIWKGYLPFVRTAGGSIMNMFDPLGSDALDRLRERRLGLLRKSSDLVSQYAEKPELEIADLERLASQV
ncbi:MAG: hypothetical protein AAGD06_13255, partial [Acidobacteriota bacterium]